MKNCILETPELGDIVRLISSLVHYYPVEPVVSMPHTRLMAGGRTACQDI